MSSPNDPNFSDERREPRFGERPDYRDAYHDEQRRPRRRGSSYDDVSDDRESYDDDRRRRRPRRPKKKKTPIVLIVVIVGVCNLGCGGALVGLLFPAYQRVQMAKKRFNNAAQFREIAIAFHRYHDKHKKFPAHAIYGNKTQPLLSWRVAILPQLGHKSLYDRFRLNEPWDSPHNKRLISEMPEVYWHPYSKDEGEKSDGLTHYQVLVTKRGASPSSMFRRGPDQMRISRITDGTSNTLLFVDAPMAVPWTKPEDLRFDPNGPLPEFGGVFPNGYNIALVDGSVHFIRYGAEPDMRALITANGGEVVRF